MFGAVRETQIAEHALKQMDYSIESIQNFKYLYIPNIENQALSQYMSTDSSQRIKPNNPNNKWCLIFFFNLTLKSNFTRCNIHSERFLLYL